MQIYGILGYPAKHSLSPAMHNAAFAALKINAEYKIFEKKPEELEAFLSSLNKEGILGLNVTIPYKEKVIPFLSKVSQEAKLIGAVNTIKVSAGKLEGFNTDAPGFLKHLKEDLGFNPQGEVISLIGAGGAAKAVAVALCKEQAQTIRIYDLDKDKAKALVSQLKDNFSSTQVLAMDSIEGLQIEDATLLINATPIGMKNIDPLLINPDSLHKNLLVYDLIYNPRETKLLSLAKNKGVKNSNGLGMLLCQGVLSFEIWTNQKAPKGLMSQVLLEKSCC